MRRVARVTLNCSAARYPIIGVELAFPEKEDGRRCRCGLFMSISCAIAARAGGTIRNSRSIPPEAARGARVAGFVPCPRASSRPRADRRARRSLQRVNRRASGRNYSRRESPRHGNHLAHQRASEHAPGDRCRCPRASSLRRGISSSVIRRPSKAHIEIDLAAMLFKAQYLDPKEP